MIAYKNLILAILMGSALFWACSPKAWQTFVSGPEAVFLSPMEKSPSDPCKQTIHYAPDIEHPNHTPMRYIRTRVLVMQAKPNDPNALSPEEAPIYARRLLEIVNYKLTLNTKMVLPLGNETPVLPINYRLVLYIDPSKENDTGVDFAIDSTMAYFNIKSSTNGSYDSRPYTQYAQYKGEVLNLVLLEHHPDSVSSPTYKASSTGTGFQTWVKLVGSKLFLEKTVRPDGSVEYNNTRAGLLLHESGHSFGLGHTWNSNDGCEDTPHHPNCWDAASPACKHDGIYSNNMMDYNNAQSALTPCQLGIVNYNFSREGSPQRRYLVPMWCEYKKDSTINIYSPVEWNGTKDLEGDIVIQNGGRLTIRCRVSLPEGARIIIKPKGTLVLDGAHLTNLCNQQWEGIEQWGNSKDKGSLIIYSPSTVDNVVHGVVWPGN